MYRTQYSQYPPISQTRPGIAYSSSIPGHRTPSIVGAGPVQPSGPVSFLRPSQNAPYGFSSNILQPQAIQSSLQQPQSLASGVQAQGANDSQQLDLSDFPALGAGGVSATAGVGTGTSGANSSGNHVNSSYAAQAQHHSSSIQGPNQAMGNGVTRDFTNTDDFPALGGQPAAHDGHLQSPGMNGYQSQQQQHSLQSASILRNNLMQPDDKRQAYGLKQNPQTPSSWSQHPGGQAAYTQATNGVSQQQQPTAYAQHQQLSQMTQAGAGQIAQDDTQSLDPGSTTDQQQLVQPHTPADQVLHSAADRWGLLALVRALRSQTDDALSSGQDLGLLGMELDNPGSLYPKFATPWADYASAAPATEPNYHLPSCYNVAPPPPNPKKAAQFSDETLFFTFYSMPRDAFQDLVAQELYNRNWRYHKGQRLWITTDGVVAPPGEASRQGVDGATWYTVWDVDAWERQPRMLRIDMRELEIREITSSSAGLSNSGSGIGAVGAERGINTSGQMSLQQQQQQQQQQQVSANAQQQQQQQYAQARQQHLRV